jgi:hypothetical protein
MPRLLSIRHFALLAGGLLAVPGAPSEQRWLIELAENDGTSLSVRMTLSIDAGRWELYSRRGAVSQSTNWWQRLLGRLAGKLPPMGALIYGSGPAVASGDSTILRGNLESQFSGKQYLRGSLRGDRLRASLAWQNDTTRVVATIDGVPARGGGPLRDYRAIAAHTRDTITALVFDPRIPQRANMQQFLRRFDAAAARAEDDLDMVAAFATAQPLIGITHFGFIRNPRMAATPIDSLITDLSLDPTQWVSMTCYGTRELCYLRVSRWDRATPFIKRAFERADSNGTKALIIDLLNNGGGDPSAMAPAAHLFRDTVTMGAVVGRLWYATHSAPPTDAEMARFPSVTSEDEAKLLLHMLREQGGVQARVPPRRPYFAGAVYLLVNERTGSASEFLVHLLKSTGRARLVGKRTAGGVLVALPHVVGDGFMVTVPEADYYARGTVRIEGHGIEPDISADDAALAVGREIQKSMPYNALLYIGRVHFNRREYGEAERIWTEAQALAPSDAAKRAVQSSIDDARRRMLLTPPSGSPPR